MNDDWFAPKRFGFGVGAPIAWQGWALLGGYLAVLAGLQHILRHEHQTAFIATMAILTILLLVIGRRHTRAD